MDKNTTKNPIKSDRKKVFTNKCKKNRSLLYKESDYRKFVRFYSLPSFFRTEEYGFKTAKDFAKYFKLSQDTLTDWKKRKEFENDVDAQLAKWSSGKTANVIASLYRTILANGKASEVKLWLQYIKGWKEGMIIEQPIKKEENKIKLDKLLENVDDKTKQQFDELLEKILPDKRKNI